jgi:peptidoglycan/LPS O-acetylase OafA/YrhL
MHHYKSLDGFRAVAVIGVVLIHNHYLPLGWIGVQMFFVLSGFLITGILQSQRETSFKQYIGRFYWRRSLRIWPLYFLFLALCALGYYFFKIAPTFKDNWFSLLTYTYNFVRFQPHFVDSDYFGHFWTLCIEEQFYLVWPFVLFFMPTLWFRRFTVFLVIAGPLIRYVTGEYFAHIFNDQMAAVKAVHNLPFSHLDAFATGALLAVFPEQVNGRLAQHARMILLGIGAVTVTLGLVNSFFLWHYHLPPHWLTFGYDNLAFFHQYVWGYSLLNLCSAALILCLLKNSFLPSLFENRVMIYIGTISYGIYVWHLPLMHVISNWWPVNPHSIIGLCRFALFSTATLLVSTISFYAFEKPFLNLKNRQPGDLLKVFRRQSPVPLQTTSRTEDLAQR